MDKEDYIVEKIEKGECPFGVLKEGKVIAQCPLGFPGCACGDELMLNPRLQKYE